MKILIAEFIRITLFVAGWFSIVYFTFFFASKGWKNGKGKEK